jgi:hypothetical protein
MASPGKKSFLLRLDPQVWTQLERLAAADLRSVNAEVEFLLREGLKRRGLSAIAENAAAPRTAAPINSRLKGEPDG